MIRRLPALVGAAAAGLLALVAATLLVSAPSAVADSGDDVFESLNVNFRVNADGSLRVQETIVLRFGANSGRHGLERFWVTREKFDDQRDQVYEITDVQVSSPSGVSTQTDLEQVDADGRDQALRLRVGDPDRTISAPKATYEIDYTVRGALRTSGSFDEFYWDAAGPEMPLIPRATIEATVPGGAQAVFCSAAKPPRSEKCHKSTVVDGVARFEARDVEPGEVMTISVQIKPGLIADNAPHLEENADVTARRTATTVLVGSAAAGLIVPVLGWIYYRRRASDRRFAGLPPGVLPARGENAKEVRDVGIEVPVAFAPPRLPLVDAGLLLEGENQVRHTTAALVGLAVDGAIRLRGGDAPEATLIDPRRARDERSATLVREMFEGEGSVVDLAEAGVLAQAHSRITDQASARAQSERWFVRRSVGKAAGLGLGGVVLVGYLGFLMVGWAILFAAPLLLSIAITMAVVRRKLRRGQRSGVGRALTDQVEGFRTYLATAEAEQLRFEEGEDIFSRYLPWAILFDLAERWTKVCEDLVAQGRLADAAPVWYYGVWNPHSFPGEVSSLNSSVGSAVSAAPDMSSSTGFGGGSAFSSGGGGGFSGGGGGGGGGGSW